MWKILLDFFDTSMCILGVWALRLRRLLTQRSNVVSELAKQISETISEFLKTDGRPRREAMRCDDVEAGAAYSFLTQRALGCGYTKAPGRAVGHNLSICLLFLPHLPRLGRN